MRASLLAYSQAEHEKPEHSVSAWLLPLLLATKINGKPLAVTVGPKLFKLNTEEPWIQTKSRFKRSLACVKVKSVPRLNPPAYHVMCLQSYPEPNRSGLIHPHAAFVEACKASANLQEDSHAR